ncbi:MAG TPA: S9 family peptidase, partial [Caulobacteraceae bacterium]|nr:S9 family peptidase [Caulobacteraceae bacterium]
LVGSDGAVLATLDFDKRSGDWRLKGGKHGEPVAQGSHPYGGVEILGQGRTAGTVIYTLTEQDETERWMEVPLAGGGAVEILAEEELAGALFDPRSGLLVGYLREGAMPEPVFFDKGRQAKVAATRKAFPGLNMRLASWNEAFDRLIVHTNGVGDSGTWWTVDLRSGKAEDIGASYPAIKSGDVGPMKMVSYKAADGLEMEGVLTLPPGREARNLPLVVFPHGGPQARDYATFDWWAQAFASRGYAVFQPNFRGSSGYGAAFTKAAEGERGRKMQTDISDGVAELARQGIVDPRRACIMGASYGGYAALAGVTLQNGLYRCAVSVAGVSDLPAYYSYLVDNHGAASPAARNWKQDVGPRDEIKEISPAALAARADAPVLLIHGKDDTVVPFEQSRAMEWALSRAGKPVEMVTLKGEDHWLSSGDTRLQMLQAAVAFVEKHNPAR